MVWVYSVYISSQPEVDLGQADYKSVSKRAFADGACHEVDWLDMNMSIQNALAFI